jgi:hypothetical protein
MHIASWKPGRSVLIAGLIFLIPALLLGQYRSRRGPATATPTHPEAYKGAVVTFHGTLKKLSKKEILVLSDENAQLLTFRRNKATKFFNNGKEVKPTSIDLETAVAVDATEDIDLKLLAAAVKVAAATEKTLEK